MYSNPELSVVMPAYNAAAYIGEAVTSILGQTYSDFELIIINDGSADSTASILNRYARLDCRIRLYHQENLGMIAALNRGCRLARGKYIARMDADDISFPRRFERQLEYISLRPAIGILGTWIQNMDKDGFVKGTWCPPINPKTIKWTNFFGVGVSHSSVLMRRNVMEELDFYRPEAVYGEDVDLWLRASSVTEFGNVPEVLNKYRVWNGSTHQRRLQIRKERHVKLLASYIRAFVHDEPPIEAVAGLRQTRIGPAPSSLGQIHATADLIQTLYDEFLKKNNTTIQEHKEISWDAAKRLASLAMHAARFEKRASASLLMRAFKLDHRLLLPSSMMKGLQRAFTH